MDEASTRLSLDISNIVTQDSSPRINIDQLEGIFSAKTEGFCELFLPTEISVQLYIRDSFIFIPASRRSLPWIEQNEHIRFKTKYNQIKKPFGTFAIKKVA